MTLFPNGIDVGDINLGTLLGDLGIGNDSVGSLLGTTGIADIAGLLNSSLDTLLGPEAALLNSTLALIDPPASCFANLLSTTELTSVLDGISLSTLVNDLTLGSGATSGHSV